MVASHPKAQQLGTLARASVFLCVLAGCGGGSTKLQVNRTAADLPRSYDAATLVAEPLKNPTSYAEAIAESFDKRLRAYLYQEGRLIDGDGLRIVYRFYEIDHGDPEARWWFGMGAGAARVTLSVTFYAASGEEIAYVSVQSEKTGMGGTFQERVHKAAKTVADFTLNQVLGRGKQASVTKR